jgi:hypothetical protein
MDVLERDRVKEYTAQERRLVPRWVMLNRVNLAAEDDGIAGAVAVLCCALPDDDDLACSWMHSNASSVIILPRLEIADLPPRSGICAFDDQRSLEARQI